MSIISASTTSTTAYKVTADTTGTLVLQTGSTPTTAVTIDTSQNVGLGVTPNGNYTLQAGSGYSTFKGASLGGFTFGASGSGYPLAGYNVRLTSTGDSYLYAVSDFANAIAYKNGQFQFLTAASGTAGNALTFTQAMTLDASGRLGIGQTSPAYTLDVNGTMRLGSAGSIQPLLSRSSSEGGLVVNTTAGGGAAFIVQNNGTEQARIDSSGNLLVNLTSQVVSGTLCVKNASVKNGIVSQDAGSANYLYQGINSSATNVFIVASTGNVTNTNNSYGAISDIKLKENITDATPKLEQLNQVRVVNYNLIGDTQKQLGVIAQELEQVFPGMVEESKDYEYVTTTDENGEEITDRIETGTTKQVKYSVFVPMLIKAIQEQQAIIETLTNRITALEAK